MPSELDYYDVERIASDKADQAKWDAQRHADDRIENLRSDVYAVVDELRETIASLERVLQSRTEHLA